ncbi:MAG TPA: dihydrodipicolinate synthase family protein [Candidatus Acidoferrales bacterium]|nr:dihydrodipicolinate synthase family protein [Candidatus Acidoferrales bacterium]
MIAAKTLTGVWSAVLTPIDERFEPDAPRAIEYYRDLLRDGIDGINLLGTTGEAMSFSVAQRMRLMELVAESIPRERTMCGTGAASLADAAALTRTANELGFSAALVMPPFFFRDAGDDGVLRWFDALLAAAGPLRVPILLYNFPRMTGITFHIALVDRLLAAFPGVIAGMKDSSNDAELQRAILARHPDLRIFPGSEEHLLEAKRFGAAGCISGSVALWAQLAHQAFANDDDAAAARVREQRSALAGAPLIALVRERVSKQRRDAAWLRSMPPN